MPLPAAFLLALTFAAEWKPAPHWTDACHFADHAVTANFESRSGDPLEDDMTVTLTRDDGVAVVLPLGRSLYEPRGLLQTVKNRCSEMAAVEMGADRVLLLLSSNGRPTWDTLVAVLLDTAALTVLDVKTNIGAIKTQDRVIVLRRAGAAALDVRLIRESLPDAGCDCEAADIEDWRRVEIAGDRIRSAWPSR